MVRLYSVCIELSPTPSLFSLPTLRTPWAASALSAASLDMQKLDQFLHSSQVSGESFSSIIRACFCELLHSSVGLLFLWSADVIRKGAPNGLEGALGTSPFFKSSNSYTFNGVGASALLLLSSLPRITKGPVPIVLAATSSAAGVYYGTKVYNLRS
jgi:uncharacterized membrane protein (UPF0136 family)